MSKHVSYFYFPKVRQGCQLQTTWNGLIHELQDHQLLGSSAGKIRKSSGMSKAEYELTIND